MIRTKSQKCYEAEEFILNTFMVAFLHPSLPFHATNALLVSHSSVPPSLSQTYSKENYALCKWTFCRCILRSLPPNFLSEILNWHSSALTLSLPPISILNKLSFALPIVPFTHYAVSSFHILNIWNALIFFGGLTNDHLSDPL